LLALPEFGHVDYVTDEWAKDIRTQTVKEVAEPIIWKTLPGFHLSLRMRFWARILRHRARSAQRSAAQGQTLPHSTPFPDR
jgi:hypothetical protein